MYIKLTIGGHGMWYDFSVYAANHHPVLLANNVWTTRGGAIRAAKKMARRLGIEYRENREN